MVNGLFDVENRLDYLTANGDILPTLKNLIPWEEFRSDLEVIYAHERKSNAGRKPFDVVMMFKILILQSLYNLSDDEMEYQIMDRLSFMRFLGMDLDSRVPDAKTIWLFRSKLETFHLTRTLFDKFNAFLACSGFEARKGQIVDATIVRVPVQRNTRKENEAIKDGKPPVENWSEAKKCQKDTDARWTKKRGKSYFGYKNHVEVDVKYKLIRKYKVTDAAVHDSRVFEELLDETNTSRDVYADSAGLYMNRYKKLMKLCLDFIISLFLKTKFISEKILQVFKLNFMNKVNTMKKIFFSSFLCGLFLTITTLFGVEKIYISNGYLNYCLSPDVANSAVVFYSLDIRDGEWKQSYLPMTIVPEIYTKYDRNKQIIKFPLAWYMNRKELFVVFHDLESDAMGRVIFWLFSTDKPHDFDFLSSFKAYEYQNNIMKYKGHYFAWDGRGDCKHIQGISSDPFALNRLTNNSKIWYDFADKNIIARFPGLNDKRVETWMPSENPPYYKWILYAIEDDKMIVIQDDKLKGFTPLSSVSVKGKKVYADNGERINFPNDIDSIIWGIDNNSTPSIVLLSQSDEIKISKKNCPKLPKLILANEDSDYVMFIFDRKIDSLNVQGSLQEIKDMLEKRHLLHQYPPRPKKATFETTEDVQHNAEEPSDEPSPEEIERRRAEYLANQPKDNIFTEDEFKTLFPKVEYDNVADLYERGMAYDWDEKYSDAMKCFEQDSSLKSKFMLAMYYKTGSPEITKDSVKANVIFKEIIGDVSNKSAPTPEMLCIAGRACMEFISTDFSERQEFQNNAEKLFKESIKQGYATAAFYPQYCIKDNGKFQPQELIEIANKNNCLDAEVLAAGLALLMNPDFMNYRNKQENLLTIKKGIQAHIPLAEYILGQLFNHDGTDLSCALKPNPELAKFWIKRAANHGEADAIELLRQNPTLRPFNR